MKYGTSKLIGSNKDAFIKVTFEDGVGNPRMHFEGLHVDGCGSPHGGYICILEAVANMFIEKCEQMKGEGSAAMIHSVNAPDDDGWIECDGNFPEVFDDSRVDVKDRVGRVDTETACYVDWDHSGGECDIIAYRLHKTQAGATDKLSSEAVSAAKIALMSDSIEELVRKPTIEQLAADYRNAKDYAERKQEEADAAKDDADARLKALEIAAEDLGFKIEPITTKQDGL